MRFGRQDAKANIDLKSGDPTGVKPEPASSDEKKVPADDKRLVREAAGAWGMKGAVGTEDVWAHQTEALCTWCTGRRYTGERIVLLGGFGCRPARAGGAGQRPVRTGPGVQEKQS